MPLGTINASSWHSLRKTAWRIFWALVWVRRSHARWRADQECPLLCSEAIKFIAWESIILLISHISIIYWRHYSLDRTFPVYHSCNHKTEQSQLLWTVHALFISSRLKIKMTFISPFVSVSYAAVYGSFITLAALCLPQLTIDRQIMWHFVILCTSSPGKEPEHNSDLDPRRERDSHWNSFQIDLWRFTAL